MDILVRLKGSSCGFDTYCYAADEIERNREAIAELVELVKESREIIISVCAMMVVGLPEEEMERFNAAIAKYDTKKETT